MATRAAAAKGKLEVWDEFGSQQQSQAKLEQPCDLQASLENFSASEAEHEPSTEQIE